MPDRSFFGLHARLLVGFVLSALILLLGLAPAEAMEYPPIFHATELKPPHTDFNVKHNAVIWGWATMSRRWQNGNSCPLPTNLCTRAGWTEMIAQLKGKDPMTQVHAVNDAFNSPRYPYKLDINNWGVPDYWATPYEFLRKSGDCEDYAIAKYMMLRALGFPATSLRLLAVSILSQGGIAHAVLLVYLGGKTWVLDILNTQVMDANLVADYKPLISLNEIDWRLELVN